MSKFVDFMRLAFCERGVPSSKRVLGGLIVVCCLAFTGWSVMTDGMTDNNKSVIEIEIVTAGTLLGVSSVTSIWKDSEKRKDDDE